MSTLDRYKKSGGFVQLLTLLETSTPSKRDKFFELIRSEDPRWADALRKKMLDLNRIYSWDDQTLAEVVGTLQDLTLAVAVNAAAEPVRTKLLAYLSHGRRRKIEDLAQTQKPTPQEVAAMHVKIIEAVRKMANEGYLRFDRFDPDLFIEENIEEKLSKASLIDSLSASTSNFTIEYGNNGDVPTESQSRYETHSDNSKDEARVIELQTLKKKLNDLSKENATLRHELSVVKGKLDQIRKIA